jgi:hypothetical protein
MSDVAESADRNKGDEEIDGPGAREDAEAFNQDSPKS